MKWDLSLEGTKQIFVQLIFQEDKWVLLYSSSYIELKSNVS